MKIRTIIHPCTSCLDCKENTMCEKAQKSLQPQAPQAIGTEYCLAEQKSERPARVEPLESLKTELNSSVANAVKRNVRLGSQKEYEKRVVSVLEKKLKKEKYRIGFAKDYGKLLGIMILNLENVHDELASLYAEKSRGRKAIDPQIVLRSFLLMHSFKEISISQWVHDLQTERIWQIFCGIEDRIDIPSVGTHYNFLDRLHDGKYQKTCSHYVSQSKIRKSARLEPRISTQEPKQEDWDAYIESEDKKCEALRQKIKARENSPRVQNMQNLMNEMLHKIAVRESYRKKLIDLKKINCFGDGTVLRTASSPSGKRACNCDDKNCMHPRKYSDPQSSFGWDGREKKVVYGYRLFQFVSAYEHHDLPIHLSLSPANAHETGMAMFAIEHMQKMYKDIEPEASLQYSSYDALYDSVSFYRFLSEYTEGYAIPYRTKPGKCLQLGGTPCTPEGLPLCSAGAAMRRHGFDKQGRSVFACPAKRLARRDGKKIYLFYPDRCPQGADCEPSQKLGPLCYIASDVDPRVFPSIPRESLLFKELQKMRSSVERSNSAKKYQYHLASARIRVLPHAYARFCFVSLLEHSRVWFAEIENRWKSIIHQKFSTNANRKVLSSLKAKECKHYENLMLLVNMTHLRP